MTGKHLKQGVHPLVKVKFGHFCPGLSRPFFSPGTWPCIFSFQFKDLPGFSRLVDTLWKALKYLPMDTLIHCFLTLLASTHPDICTYLKILDKI
jgi:hypothetical protein